MNPRTTGILFLIAAALGAWVYFYEIRGEPARQEAEEAAKRLFSGIEAGDIEWIELTASDDTPVRLERRGDGWALTEPLDFPGDKFAVDGIASALAQVTSEQVIESPQAEKIYGLGDDSREVRFGTADSKHTLRTGDKTPVGSNSYVSTGESAKVYTVPSYRVNALTKTVFDLREKRLLVFDTASISRVAASWPDGGVVLERGEDGWRLTEPLAGPADADTVEKLLSDLSFLRAVGFQDESLPDEAVGLAKPAFQVELTANAKPEAEDEDEGEGEGEGGDEAAAEPSVYRLAIGASVDGKNRLARAGQASLYRIPSERLSDLPRTVVAYRFKQVSKFPVAKAARVELVLRDESGAPVTITATRGTSGWTSEPEAFQAGKLSRLVSEVSSLRAENILADSMGPDELKGLQLAPPNSVLRVFGSAPESGGEPERLAELHLGRVRGHDGIAAQSAGSEMVFEVAYDLAEHVPVSLDAFHNRFAASEKKAEEEATPESSEDLPAQASKDEP